MALHQSGAPGPATLYLGSDGLPGLEELIRPRSRVLLVPTAAATLEDRSHMARDLRRLEVLGLRPERLDLDAAAPVAVRRALGRADALFVTGGSLSYLLHHAQRSEFLQTAANRVREGLLYAGLSAGAILAGPDAAPILASSPRPLRVELDSSRCMGLVDFVVLPHDADPVARARNDRIVASFAAGFRFVRLTDRQAMIINSGQARLVEATDRVVH